MDYMYQQHVQFSTRLSLETRSTPIVSYLPTYLRSSNHADCGGLNHLMILNQGFTQIGTSNHHFQTSFSYVRMHVLQLRVQATYPYNTYNNCRYSPSPRVTLAKVLVILDHTRSSLPMIPTSLRTHPAVS